MIKQNNNTPGKLQSAPILVLVGPTAIGKTSLSLQLATMFHCEIISMDSMQVYRFMDIGTAKASLAERQQVCHHLIDIRNPDQQYSAADFVRDCLKAMDDIVSRSKIPLITGGTGLYLSSLINGLFDDIEVKDDIRYKLKERLKKEGREVLHAELVRLDPISAARVHMNDTQRLLRGLEIFYSTGHPWSEHLRRQKEKTGGARPFSRMLQIGLHCEREALYERIARRSHQMIQDNFQAEVESLLARGYDPHLPAMQALGYRHMTAFLAGERNLADTVEQLIRDTRRYAKRQMTWFRSCQDLCWYDVGEEEHVTRHVARFVQSAQEIF